MQLARREEPQHTACALVARPSHADSEHTGSVRLWQAEVSAKAEAAEGLREEPHPAWAAPQHRARAAAGCAWARRRSAPRDGPEWTAVGKLDARHRREGRLTTVKRRTGAQAVYGRELLAQDQRGFKAAQGIVLRSIRPRLLAHQPASPRLVHVVRLRGRPLIHLDDLLQLRAESGQRVAGAEREPQPVSHGVPYPDRGPPLQPPLRSAGSAPCRAAWARAAHYLPSQASPPPCLLPHLVRALVVRGVQVRAAQRLRGGKGERMRHEVET
jgi:hypothetical protein